MPARCVACGAWLLFLSSLAARGLALRQQAAGSSSKAEPCGVRMHDHATPARPRGLLLHCTHARMHTAIVQQQQQAGMREPATHTAILHAPTARTALLGSSRHAARPPRTTVHVIAACGKQAGSRCVDGCDSMRSPSSSETIACCFWCSHAFWRK